MFSVSYGIQIKFDFEIILLWVSLCFSFVFRLFLIFILDIPIDSERYTPVIYNRMYEH